LAIGLDASPHTIAVTRDAEAFAGVHEFLGFEVDGGRLLAPRSRSRRIEIVGDSITCGYGVLGADARCPFTYATERASVAYGALAAQTLAADVTTVCWSGRGVVRNYDGDTTALAPELFEQAIPAIDGAPAMPFDFARAVEPDALVANLGTNDFLGGAGQPLDIAAFERAYVRFLRRVRAVYPRALLVVALSPMLGPDPTPSTASKPTRDVARASLERVVAMRRAEGDERISLLELEHQGERVGCDEHPNAEMHRVLARQLVSFLRGALRW
ncbi:MAG TPA: GDSL-type esterase/lipase family protein, partial [Labilithrix sp.]|nr:GDSL-type esterase/lipase family protein [Labilithrix sp.]